PGPYPQQYPQPGGPTTPQGWPPQQYPPPAKRSKGALVGAVAATVVVVAAVAAVVVVLTSKNSSSGPPTPPVSSSSTGLRSSSPPPTSPPPSTPADTGRSEASAVSNVLTDMANTRAELGTPSNEVSGCYALSDAISQLQGVVSSRQSQLATAQNLSTGLLP